MRAAPGHQRGLEVAHLRGTLGLLRQLLEPPGVNQTLTDRTAQEPRGDLGPARRDRPGSQA